jgi:hypothetical protein
MLEGETYQRFDDSKLKAARNRHGYVKKYRTDCNTVK